MDKFAEENKIAWEYDAYNFWVSQDKPADRAKEDLENPRKMLRNYARYFDDVTGMKIAVICGSAGKKAIPLSIMGAAVTIFDISEANKRYACEVADAAGAQLEYIVGDVMDIDMSAFGGKFDVVFMEGGILHYFHDIDGFMSIMNSLLRNGGRMICSDFHPIHKLIDALELGNPGTDYFSEDIIQSEVAHARFYEDEIRRKFPKCNIRRYTLSEIINSTIKNGFVIRAFDEFPAWYKRNLPGEFALLADKVE